MSKVERAVTLDVELQGTDARLLAAIGEKQGKSVNEVVVAAVERYLDDRLRLVRIEAA